MSKHVPNKRTKFLASLLTSFFTSTRLFNSSMLSKVFLISVVISIISKAYLLQSQTSYFEYIFNVFCFLIIGLVFGSLFLLQLIVAVIEKKVSDNRNVVK